jgi:hypothetical protein
MSANAMDTLKRDYKGFEISARAPCGAAGYVPEVVLVRYSGGESVRERKFLPRVRAGFESEEAALDCAMQHGFELVDGDIEGFDPETML